jgi:hypothetical protein
VVALLGLRNGPPTVLSALLKPFYHGILRIHGKENMGLDSVWYVAVRSNRAVEEP